ncbi:MAG: thiolase family protein [Leptospiraceae bacterium]|nr:thiolase family protein [Leptospiraceae bacterium]
MRAKIIGSAESKFVQKEEELNLEEMVFFTAKKAMESAGLSRDEIDTVIQAGDDVMDGININHVYQIEPAGAYLKEESKVEEDGAFALFYALCRLATGKFNTALVIGYSKSSESSVEFIKNVKSQTNPESTGGWYYFTQMDPFYLRPLGLDNLSYHAMQYRQFLSETSLTEEDIARITVKNKAAGKGNPNAIFAGDYSISDVVNSTEIASPLKELQIPYMTDGVSAIVIAREEWAKEKHKEGATITGLGTASDAYYPGYRDFASVPTAKIAKDKAFQMAGIKSTDVQLAELYELFPYQEAMLYKEIFGWSYEEIKEKLSSGYTTETGNLPVNVSGGVSCAHPIMAAGLSRIINAVHLMDKRSLKTTLAHSQSGLGMQSNIVYILQS